MGEYSPIKRARFHVGDWPMYYLATTEVQHVRNIGLRLHPFGLRPPEWRLLAILDEQNGRTIGHIAEIAALERSTVSKIVDTMEQRGWLRRGTEDRDRRRSPVFVTEKGKRKYEEALPVILDLFRSYFDGMSHDEFRRVMDTVRDLKKRVGRAAHPGAGQASGQVSGRPRRSGRRNRSRS
jgi:DNA-binding MarR family transcriptional regulator